MEDFNLEEVLNSSENNKEVVETKEPKPKGKISGGKITACVF